jgi:RND family efflux transporter MFP subunit
MHLLNKYHKAFLLFAIASGLIFWIVSNAPEPLKTPKITKLPKIPFVEVLLADQAIPVLSRGRVTASEIRQISSEIPGLVKHLSKNLMKGAWVKKNDLLIQLDEQPFILDIAQKQAQLDLTRLNLIKTKATAKVARKGLSEASSDYARHIPQLREANSRVDAAQAALNYAESQLKKTAIRAPIDGNIIELHITEGEYIPATFAIAKIYGTKMVEVRLPLNDRQIDILGIQHNQQQMTNSNASGESKSKADEFSANPKVTVSTYQDKSHHWYGHIARTEGERDSNQLLYVIAQVPSQNPLNPSRKPLLPGSFVEANIQGKTIQGLKIIPRNAEQENGKVWIINQDNLLVSNKVEVLYRGKEKLYLGAGLHEKDRVVTGAFHLMAEGIEVEPKAEVSSLIKQALAKDTLPSRNKGLGLSTIK